MKKKLRSLLLYSVCCTLLLALGYLAFVEPILSYDTAIPPEKPCRGTDRFDLAAHLRAIDPNRWPDEFPYGPYLDSARLCDIQRIEQHIILMDSLQPGREREHRDLLIRVLTIEREERMAPSFSTYDPEALIDLLFWASRFQHPGPVAEANRIVYGITYDHWMNFIAHRLGAFHAEDPTLKYDHTFKYLLSTCQAKRYAPSIHKTRSEKVVQYLSERKISYLFRRMLYGTSLTEKAGLLFLLMVVLPGGYLTLYTLKNRSK